MSTIAASEPITVNCAECADGRYIVTQHDPDLAVCELCDTALMVSFDIVRHLTNSEFVVASAGAPLAVFTVETMDVDA